MKCFKTFILDLFVTAHNKENVTINWFLFYLDDVISSLPPTEAFSLPFKMTFKFFVKNTLFFPLA